MMGAIVEVAGRKVKGMGAFGERLRREREMRGISLNEISESTKISRRHLESLENEDFDSLPGGVFNRGFVRAYAHFVGINEDQAVADYNAVRKEPELTPDQFPLEVHVKPDRELNPKRSPLQLILAVAALVGFIVAVWVRSLSHQPEPAKSAPTPEPASLSTPSSDASAKPVSTPPPATPSPASPPPPSVLPVKAVVRPSESSASDDKKTATGGATPAATPDKKIAAPAVAPAATPDKRIAMPTATPTATPDRTFVLVVRAKEDAWVSLVVDGKRSWEGIMRADRQRLVRAGKQVVLTTGNAGGLVVTHNGKVLRALGSESEVRTLRFTRAGLVQ